MGLGHSILWGVERVLLVVEIMVSLLGLLCVGLLCVGLLCVGLLCVGLLCVGLLCEGLLCVGLLTDMTVWGPAMM